MWGTIPTEPSDAVQISTKDDPAPPRARRCKNGAVRCKNGAKRVRNRVSPIIILRPTRILQPVDQLIACVTSSEGRDMRQPITPTQCTRSVPIRTALARNPASTHSTRVARVHRSELLTPLPNEDAACCKGVVTNPLGGPRAADAKYCWTSSFGDARGAAACTRWNHDVLLGVVAAPPCEQRRELERANVGSRLHVVGSGSFKS